MSRIVDITGKYFGRLTILRKVDNDKWGHIRYLCRCKCKNEKIVLKNDLESGRTKSCGCLQKELLVFRSTKHGHTPKGQWSPIYRSWKNMVQRCTNPKNKDYLNYGGRGITVCKQWMEFSNFLEDMGENWGPGLTLDRINNEKGYYKKNCRWATRNIQNRNSRHNRLITHNGKTQCMAAWAEEIGIFYNTLVCRFKRGWSPERALAIPAKNMENLEQINGFDV